VARAIGIDLGTTHSLVAFVDERNRPRVIPDDAGAPLLPSAVAYGPGAAVEVGASARARAPERPHDVVLSVKRLVGRGPAELDPADRGVLRLAADGAVARILVDDGRRAVTPVEVSAEILRVLAGRARRALGGAPGGCVVTVPAYFDDAQRQATRDAARLAGLDVLRLLAEPTAAALAYGLDQRLEGTFAVYDLGGGTFDLSILRLEGGVFEVLATAGDTHLGGDDFDRAVAEWLLGQVGEGSGSGTGTGSGSGSGSGTLGPLSPRADGAVDGVRAGGEGRGGGGGWRPRVLATALSAARELRERLSTQGEASVDLPLPDGTRLAARLTRDALETLLLPIVDRTTAPCRDALRAAGVDRLDGVVLVGGATRTPLVRRHVRALFGQEPLTDLDPDTVVALGAAIQADLLDRGAREDVLLLDVVPLTLGVETLGGVVEPLIPRNSTIPASASQRFTTHADGQTGMVFHVVQGERELAKDCRSLARFTLKGLPRLRAGGADVEVVFTVDADGILRVAAREVSTGAEIRVQVKPTHGLGEDEVERMLVESLAHAEEDVTERFLREWRLEGERNLAALDDALRSDPDLLAPGERALLDGRAAGLRRAMTGEDFLAVKAWLSSLDEAAQPFVERRLDRLAARALAGRRVDDVDEKKATGDRLQATGTPLLKP
jgi:molecular chaperone HscA